MPKVVTEYAPLKEATPPGTADTGLAPIGYGNSLAGTNSGKVDKNPIDAQIARNMGQDGPQNVRVDSHARHPLSGRFTKFGGKR